MISKSKAHQQAATVDAPASPRKSAPEDNNPFRRKHVAENQVIETDSAPFPDKPANRVSLEYLELEVNDARQRVRDIAIVEFDADRFTGLAGSTGSNCGERSNDKTCRTTA